ncbi:hypothetical protein PVAND_002263 [Polypedilum vanderplanki]|uniref:Zinc metalloproteinase n=1 Tax=Polypedilum vanderplanki TaxID=319348 RepID=A0A9J6BQG1_POLVA|nr:hypothetical protein PVAND_002263 [Polypedilum vanderplanki]
MNCKDHSIEIKNYGKNIFSREIILISGCIKNKCEHEYIELLQDDCVSQKAKIINRSFKFLLKLNKNQINVIKLKYCQIESVLHLEHISKDKVFYDVQPLYIIPKNHDGKFQSFNDTNNTIDDALMKIDLLTSLAQCVYSSKVYEEDENNSFVLNKCKVFRSSMNVEEVWQYTQFELYDKIAQEIVDKYGTEIIEKRKFIAFISCTKFLGLYENDEYNYTNIRNKTKANPSLSCGFLALLGNGCFYTLPNNVNQVIDAFNDKTIVDTRVLLDDSNYRKTYGGNFSTTLGSLVHEIGHLFDLGHTENGLMGNDIDHVHRFFLCQNFTEIMPKRNVSNCQQLIKSKEKNEYTNKFTKINRNGAFMDKYHEQKNKDLTFFEKNCQITLMNHRWFTQNILQDSLLFDENKNVVYSSEFIMLVEVRELEKKNSLTKKFWDLSEKNIKEFKIDFDLSNSTLFVVTNNGSILKKNFHA